MPAYGKRRALGQHFLKDRSIIQKITETGVRLALEKGCRALLEIGPGKGAITDPLHELLGSQRQIERFILAERDRDLVALWREKAIATVEEGDFMDLPEERWLGLTPLAVVSNLPYSAGTAIATRLAEHPDKIPVMVLMFQAEVAQRLRAESGTKSWGSLSIWIQNRWDVEKLLFVPPGAFAPPPEVDSEVVVLRARAEPRLPIPLHSPEDGLWQQLLKTCFLHRRKMLRAGLKGHPRFFDGLQKSGIDPTKRAEALSWDEWQKLFAASAGKS